MCAALQAAVFRHFSKQPVGDEATVEQVFWIKNFAVIHHSKPFLSAELFFKFKLIEDKAAG